MEQAEPELEEFEGDVIARTHEVARWRETGDLAYERDFALRLMLDNERIVRNSPRMSCSTRSYVPRLLESCPPLREHEHTGPSYRQGATVVRMTLVLLAGFGGLELRFVGQDEFIRALGEELGSSPHDEVEIVSQGEVPTRNSRSMVYGRTR